PIKRITVITRANRIRVRSMTTNMAAGLQIIQMMKTVLPGPAEAFSARSLYDTIRGTVLGWTIKRTSYLETIKRPGEQ
ncbi:MAG: hypothetical protein WBJ00_08350, partial [Dethiobacteria bacterium]